MARTSDIELYLATDTNLRIDVDDGTSPQNMTGWALAFILRPRTVPGTGTPATVSKTTSSGITIGNGTATGDRATVALADSDLPATLTPGRGYHAALWRTDDGSDTPLWHGTVTLKAVAQQAS